MHNFKRVSLALMLWTGLAGAGRCGDMVVIVNKANTHTGDLALVSKIFTGAQLSWADGTPIVALDQADNAAKSSFASMLGKSTGSIKAAWANLMFAGKATPPKVVDGDAEVKAAVAANKAAIGYINATAVDASVKVLVK
ncbi:hypothetical protein [Duganella sp.]|uniref:hypothetical protein n=1 Tax=Duganella sp. TaxID=1904440 RepID=UPI0031D6F7AF